MTAFYIDVVDDTDKANDCCDRAPVEPNYACTREKGHTGPHACSFAVWGESDSASLRDEFAKAALTGMLARDGHRHLAAATEAYKFADAMLEARTK